MIRKAQWEGQKTVLQACGRMKDSHLGQKHPEDLCTQGSQHTAHGGKDQVTEGQGWLLGRSSM